MKDVLDDIDRWRADGAAMRYAVVGTDGSDRGEAGPGCQRRRKSQDRCQAAASSSRHRALNVVVLAQAGVMRSGTRMTRLSLSADVRQDDSPVRRAARLVSPSIYEQLRDLLRAEEPVALATVVTGPQLAPSSSCGRR
jgi:hypothetical protein